MTDTDLSAFADFLDDDGFTTPPIKSSNFPEGKPYLVPSPDGVTGARLSALVAIAAKKSQKLEVTANDLQKIKFSDDEERDLMQMCLGTAYGEMMDDGVTWQRISRIGQYALVVITQGEQAAKDAAAAGIFSGKAPARNRAQTRAATKSAGSPRTTPPASPSTRKRPARPTA